MIREYVDGHKFNGKKMVHIHGVKAFMVKGCVRCDGKERAFIGWCPSHINNAEDIAQAYFDSYLKSECVCMNPENTEGLNPPCPVHGDWTKEKDGIEYHTNGAGI